MPRNRQNVVPEELCLMLNQILELLNYLLANDNYFLKGKELMNAEPSGTRPMKRQYSRIERERRFLLDRLPYQADPANFQRVRDRYIHGTNCRLRWIENPDGSEKIAKLGQKLPCSMHSPCARHREMTTLYMSFAEAKVFAQLPGRDLVKRRYYLEEQGYTFAIDVFEEPKSIIPLIICEVECDTDEELEKIQTPAWAVRDH
ncbi:MAG: hypothetical protein R3C03_18280 [Pirellulaceae bacterium]